MAQTRMRGPLHVPPPQVTGTWKVRTEKYRSVDGECESCVSEIFTGDFRLAVHRSTANDPWFATLYPSVIENRELKAKTIKEAQHEALTLAIQTLLATARILHNQWLKSRDANE